MCEDVRACVNVSTIVYLRVCVQCVRVGGGREGGGICVLVCVFVCVCM